MSEQLITSILVIASTARSKYADSSMFVEVLIPEIAAAELDLAGAKGSTRVVSVSASGTKKASEILPSDITLSAEPPNEGNAWLPASLYILGKGDDGDYEVICAIPEWPEQIWISEDPTDHAFPEAFPAINLENVLKALNPA